MPYFDDNTHINHPYGLGTDGTNVWIADSYGLRVMKFSNTGSFLMKIGKAGFRHGVPAPSPAQVHLDWITDVTVDSAGNFWVVDGNVNVVYEFDASGNYVSEMGQRWTCGTGNNRFCRPQGVAFDSTGNIYVSDSNNHRIQVFDSSRNYLTTLGEAGVPGVDNAHFGAPGHIAIDNSDNLYVADSWGQRVQIFDSSHAYVATVGVSNVPGSDNSHFNQPSGVFVDGTRILVADSNNHRVQIFNRSTRAYLRTLGTGGAGSGNNQFNTPTDVAVDSSGNIFVADYGKNSRVQQFNSSYNYVRTLGTTGVPYLTNNYLYNRPKGLAVGPDGSIYMLEANGQRLLKMNPNGLPLWSVGEAGIWGSDNGHFSFPSDVTVDASGKVYVADNSNNRIQIFSSSGGYLATLGGTAGTGNYQFKGALGVAVDSAGNIYVADRSNHRVQVYNSSRVYVATLGVTGVWGSDNNHFNNPGNVAVDSAGRIYVVDQNNYRVQVFNSGRGYVRTIGETGVKGSDFGHFTGPADVAVDPSGRIYVSDRADFIVKVFDRSGAFLTSVAGGYGNLTGQLRSPEMLALDSAGNLYVADSVNHRIQKFAPGVPGWTQTNINGFGDRNNLVLALAPFNGQLFAGVLNLNGYVAHIWRKAIGGAWSKVMTNGFGDPANIAIDHMQQFAGNLYAGTINDNGGQVWRSSTGNSGSWTQVVSGGFGDATNGEVFRFAVFDSQIYASTWSYTTTHGSEIWRSSTGNSGEWSQVVDNGFGDSSNDVILSFAARDDDGYLYAGTHNWNQTSSTSTGGEVWRTNDDGTTWAQVNADGFGDANNTSISALTSFNGWLYASTGHSPGAGAQVWRCQVCDGSDWGRVMNNGFGNTNTRDYNGLEVLGDYLYFVGGNRTTGMEVWRTRNGTDWAQVGFAGLGDSSNRVYYDNSVVALNGSLYVGTLNSANGAEVWQYYPPRERPGVLP